MDLELGAAAFSVVLIFSVDECKCSMFGSAEVLGVTCGRMAKTGVQLVGRKRYEQRATLPSKLVSDYPGFSTEKNSPSYMQYSI
jgi:hypothetical protein